MWAVVTITPGPELITLSGQIIISSPHKNHHHWIYHCVISFLMLRGWVRFNSIFWLMTRWVASWRFLISNEAITDKSGEHGRQGQNEHLTRLSHSAKCCVCGLFVWSQVTPGPESLLLIIPPAANRGENMKSPIPGFLFKGRIHPLGVKSN